MDVLQIENTIISFEVLETYFFCQLTKCKGACCVEGDAGAPLTHEEIDVMVDLLPIVLPELSEQSQKVISTQGFYYKDTENEPVTSLVNGRECVFAYQEGTGVWKCAIEKLYLEGKSNFPKPVSCHLYPIRVQKYMGFWAVNYHRWDICHCALDFGQDLKIPLFQFLKDPLIRKFGESWYEQLCIAHRELCNQSK